MRPAKGEKRLQCREGAAGAFDFGLQSSRGWTDRTLNSEPALRGRAGNGAKPPGDVGVVEGQEPR